METKFLFGWKFETLHGKINNGNERKNQDPKTKMDTIYQQMKEKLVFLRKICSYLKKKNIL